MQELCLWSGAFQRLATGQVSVQAGPGALRGLGSSWARSWAQEENSREGACCRHGNTVHSVTVGRLPPTCGCHSAPWNPLTRLSLGALSITMSSEAQLSLGTCTAYHFRLVSAGPGRCFQTGKAFGSCHPGSKVPAGTVAVAVGGWGEGRRGDLTDPGAPVSILARGPDQSLSLQRSGWGGSLSPPSNSASPILGLGTQLILLHPMMLETLPVQCLGAMPGGA